MKARSALHPRVAELDEAELSREEWARLAAIPITAEEAAEIRELVAWFRRRYPTVKARMVYARRKYDDVTRPRGASSPR